MAQQARQRRLPQRYRGEQEIDNVVTNAEAWHRRVIRTRTYHHGEDHQRADEVHQGVAATPHSAHAVVRNDHRDDNVYHRHGRLAPDPEADIRPRTRSRHFGASLHGSSAASVASDTRTDDPGFETVLVRDPIYTFMSTELTNSYIHFRMCSCMYLTILYLSHPVARKTLMSGVPVTIVYLSGIVVSSRLTM
jgi:hypothetical protein